MFLRFSCHFAGAQTPNSEQSGRRNKTEKVLLCFVVCVQFLFPTLQPARYDRMFTVTRDFEPREITTHDGKMQLAVKEGDIVYVSGLLLS